jgi:hemoglobin
MERPSLYEFAGGEPAFLALAAAHHERCLRDPVLAHAFSHGTRPDHVQRLAYYWMEVLGGPARFSAAVDDPGGAHSAMLGLHANNDAETDLGERFAACFVAAMDDAGLPEDERLRASLRGYIEWAAAEVMAYSPRHAQVPSGLPMPHWTWHGLAP